MRLCRKSLSTHNANDLIVAETQILWSSPMARAMIAALKPT